MALALALMNAACFVKTFGWMDADVLKGYLLFFLSWVVIVIIWISCFIICVCIIYNLNDFSI
ncbi:hypothetical protein ACE6H2_023234 [Prunus campanulata]